MTYYAIAALLNGIGSTLLGLAVYFNSMKRKVNEGSPCFAFAFLSGASVIFSGKHLKIRFPLSSGPGLS